MWPGFSLYRIFVRAIIPINLKNMGLAPNRRLGKLTKIFFYSQNNWQLFSGRDTFVLHLLSAFFLQF